MARQSAEQTINISAPISLSLAKKLEKVAKFDSRPKTYYIRQALEYLMAERMQDIADYIEAKKILADMKASGEETIPYEEIRKKYHL